MASDTALVKALNQLAKALDYARRETDPGIFEQFRNSVIQTYEYSWELTTKYLRRTLVERAASADEILSLSFPDLLRLAAAQGFIESVEEWLVFRAIRNKTSHGYEETFANEAYTHAGPFLEAARHMLDRLASS
ncbi:MAG: nucleotidyltransferase substrate binding protein [Spirochaetota bacterium]